MATSPSLLHQDVNSSRDPNLPTPRKGRKGKQFGALLTIPGQSTTSASTDTNGSRSLSSAKTNSSSIQTPGTHRHDQNRTSNTRKEKQTVQVAPSHPNTPHSPARKDKPKSVISPAIVNNERDDGGDVCLICAEPIKYYALGACSHRTCHVCSLRMRALYKKRDCALCKTELPVIIFTTDPEASFNSYDLSALEFKDPHLSIYCETFEQLDELLGHLKFNCPHPLCSSVLNNWKDLKFHTRSSHGLVLCELCCSNKKVFAHEHTLLTPKGLVVHMNQGSVGAGKGLCGSAFKHETKVDHDAQDHEDGFTGHPKCDFCATHFYDDDQLYQHCRDKHEQCFICLRNGIDRWRYYLNYKHLESHFRHDHYLCTQSACLEARFMVYETALDLQAHQIEVHGAEMGMRAIKDARKLEINFNYSGSKEPQLQANNLPGREHRAGPAIMVMDIAPMRGEGSSILSNANRIVPGLGTNPERNGNRQSGKGKSKSTSQDRRNDCAIQSSSIDINDLGSGSSKSTPSLELQRHAVLLERVSEAVNGVEAKITLFKVATRTYRKNEMAASDFLDNLCNIFEYHSETIGSILSNLLDLLDIEDERKEILLEKWLDLKISGSQYPSLNANANSSKDSSSGLATHLKTLSGSSWVRQKPKYSQMLGGPKKNRNQEVPGLASKTRSVGGQNLTAWSSGSNSQPQPTNSNFPSLTSNPFPSLPKNPKTQSSWKASIAARDSHSKSTTSNTKEWGCSNIPPGQLLSQVNGISSSVNGQPPMTSGSGKKPKKIVLFSNAR